MINITKTITYFEKYRFFLLIVFISCSYNSNENGDSEILKRSSENIYHPHGNKHLDFDGYSNKTMFTGPNAEQERSSIVDFFNLSKHEKIGVLFGNKEEMFGEIKDLKLDEFGNIYLLDGTERNVKVYSSSGKLVNIYSRSGSGPGELIQPTSMSILENRYLLITDGMMKIEVFDLISEEHLYSHLLEFPPQDVCTIGKQIFVLGTSPKLEARHSIHKFIFNDSNLTFEASFGELYPTNLDYISSTLTQRKLTCNEFTDTITSASTIFPFLYNYDVNGQLNWKINITDFLQRNIIQTKVDGYPGLLYATNDNEVDTFVSIVSDLDTSLIYIQYLRANNFSNNLSLKSFISSSVIFTMELDVEKETLTLISDSFLPINALSKKYLISTEINSEPLYPVIISYLRN
jgi:hypothetical protein